LRSVSAASRYWIDGRHSNLIEGVFRGYLSLGIRFKGHDRETPHAFWGRSGTAWPPGRVVPLSENGRFLTFLTARMPSRWILEKTRLEAEPTSP
jgi:hypothetical protein